MELTENTTYSESSSPLKGRSWYDWLFAALLLVGALFALSRYGEFMDVYEKAILLAAVPTFAGLGWY